MKPGIRASESYCQPEEPPEFGTRTVTRALTRPGTGPTAADSAGLEPRLSCSVGSNVGVGSDVGPASLPTSESPGHTAAIHRDPAWAGGFWQVTMKLETPHWHASGLDSECLARLSR